MAKLTKPLYFTDEMIELEIEIDNRQSTQQIEFIDVVLKQEIKIRKTSLVESDLEQKSTLSKETYSLKYLGFGDLEEG